MAGALSGLKVVEVGEMVSAAYAAKLMADAGAEVIKIERPGSGDRARGYGPFPGDASHREKSGLFLYLNSNKRGVTLDLARPGALELLGGLIGRSDVLIHNLAAPEMDRLGLTFQWAQRHNPRLIMTSVLPFGLTGPYRDRRAEDLTVWCAGGTCYLNGDGAHPELPPLKVFGHQAGYQAGAHAAVATMGAVLARERGATGQHVEVSAQESVAAILEMTFAFWPYTGTVASRLGLRPVQPLQAMECRDGWIFLCCIEEHQWRNFVELMGNPEWAGEEIFSDRLKRSENWDALKIFLNDWVSQQTVDELYRKAQARRIPFAPVSSIGDLLNSDHLRARGFFAAIDHPVAGTFEYPGAPVKYSRTPWTLRRPAPVLGQHNEEIYREYLGLSAEKLEQFRRAGIV